MYWSDNVINTLSFKQITLSIHPLPSLIEVSLLHPEWRDNAVVHDYNLVLPVLLLLDAIDFTVNVTVVNTDSSVICLHNSEYWFVSMQGVEPRTPDDSVPLLEWQLTVNEYCLNLVEEGSNTHLEQ